MADVLQQLLDATPAPQRPGVLAELYGDPFAAAAASTSRAVRPEGGRTRGATTAVMEKYVPHVLESLISLPRRALDAAGELQRTGDVYDPGPALETAGMMVGAPGVPRGAVGSSVGKLPIAGLPQPQGIRAYHGSPYDFERFDMSKIGTGEGAQAYGHGLYFAENPMVAGDYKTRLAGYKAKLPDDVISLPPEMRQAVTTHARTDVDAATAAKRAQYMSSALREVDFGKITDMIERVRQAERGRMYEVNIRAQPEQFLDWDKPLAQQNPQVQAFWEQQFPKRTSGEIPRGETIYRNAAISAYEPGSLTSAAPKVSDALREAGIPGIKYLDQGSRNWAMMKPEPHEFLNGQMGWKVNGPRGDVTFDTMPEAQAFIDSLSKGQTSNYVLFRDDIIDILRKYGLAGGAALPIAGFSFPQPEAAQ